jgi:hypothetical protein
VTVGSNNSSRTHTTQQYQHCQNFEKEGIKLRRISGDYLPVDMLVNRRRFKSSAAPLSELQIPQKT